MIPARADNNGMISETLIRPRTMVDLILNADLISDRIDVRKSMVLDITDGAAILAQTSPPLLKSMTGQKVEATFVRYDRRASKHSRLGWLSRIVEIDSHFKLIPDKSDSPVEPVVIIELPAEGLVRPSNVRLDFRLTVKKPETIGIKCRPCPGENLRLVNFSTGGMLLTMGCRPTAEPPNIRPGREMKMELVFPGSEGIACLAEVVRVEHVPGQTAARLGLKFIDLSRDACRTLQKVIYHRLAEDRR